LDEAPARRLDQEVVRRIGRDVLRRTIAIMRDAHHGGTLLILPPEAVVDGKIAVPYLNIKYAFPAGEARRRYRRAILPLLPAFASEEPEADPHVVAANEAIFELSQLMAALADVDGVVVLTRRFEIVGFGAEIVGALPHVNRVARALDLEAVTCAHESTDG